MYSSGKSLDFSLVHFHFITLTFLLSHSGSYLTEHLKFQLQFSFQNHLDK